MNEIDKNDAPAGYIAVREKREDDCCGCAFDGDALCDGYKPCDPGSRKDGRDVIFLKDEQKPGIPGHALCLTRPGNQWRCTFGDFVDLATSPAGFGATINDAIAGLATDCKNDGSKSCSNKS